MADKEQAPPTLQFKTTGEFLPRNERTEKLLEKRRQEEAKRKKEEEERRLKFEKEEREKKKKERNQKAMKEKQAKLEQDRKIQQAIEEQERSRLQGKIHIISQRLKSNTSPGQYSLSGIELFQNTTLVLCNDVKFNKTLKCLHMSKKKLKDDQGVLIAQMLAENT